MYGFAQSNAELENELTAEAEYVLEGTIHQLCAGLYQYLPGYPLDPFTLFDKLKYDAHRLSSIPKFWSDSTADDLKTDTALGTYNVEATEWLKRDIANLEARLVSMSIRHGLLDALQQGLYEEALKMSADGILARKRDQSKVG